MINGDHAANLANLFIGPLGSEEIEDGEDDARDITQPSGLDLHGGPKASIEGGQDPSRAEICRVVHVGHWFGARETDEGAEVAGSVEVEHGQGNGLPGRQPFGKEAREALRAGRSMSVTPIEIHSPKRQDGKHLEAPRLGRRSAEDVVEHVGCRSGRVTEVWEKALVKHSSHPSETRDTESKQNRQTERQEASKRSTSGGDRYVAGKVE